MKKISSILYCQPYVAIDPHRMLLVILWNFCIISQPIVSDNKHVKF